MQSKMLSWSLKYIKNYFSSLNSKKFIFGSKVLKSSYFISKLLKYITQSLNFKNDLFLSLFLSLNYKKKLQSFRMKKSFLKFRKKKKTFDSNK